MKGSNYFSGAALGFAVAAGVLLVFLWMSDGVPDIWFDVAAEIFAVLATLLAAFIALNGVYTSIEANEKARVSERKQKLEAAAATLPLVLAQVHSLTENRVEALLHGIQHQRKEPWHIDSDAVQVFRDCIEFSDGAVRDRLQEILAAYQICTSRFETRTLNVSIDDPTLGALDKYNRYSQCADWISLRIIASGLYRFARNRNAPDERSEVFGTTMRELGWLSLNGWMLTNDPDFQAYMSILARREVAGFSDPQWRWQ